MTKRSRHAMPDDVRKAIATGSVADDYAARPAYQRNDYVGWITGAKRAATREKRLHQMVAELKAGGVYMGMKHAPSTKG